VSLRRRRQARADAAERAAQGEKHRRMAAHAHEQLRELGQTGRHLYPWFEQHVEVWRAAWPPSSRSTSLTAPSTTSSARPGSRRSPRPASPPTGQSPSASSSNSSWATETRGSGSCSRSPRSSTGEQGVSLSALLAELDGEDLDRVLEAIALLKRRGSPTQGSPDDLWIRAAEPDREPGGGSRSLPDA
jgi:hypothetical protein